MHIEALNVEVEPASQLMQLLTPAGEYCPGLQPVHKTAAFAYCPLGHAKQVGALPPEYKPLGQGKQFDVVPSLYWPPLQVRQINGAKIYCPAGHDASTLPNNK